VLLIRVISITFDIVINVFIYLLVNESIHLIVS
jgi:hypothetical protein